MAHKKKLKCRGGTTKCGNICTNLQFDPNNCGACGIVVPTGLTCVGGTPTLVCPPGQTNCSGTCVNLASDPNNCGACDNPVQRGDTCVDGVSTLVCPPGYSACVPMPAWT